MSWPSTVKVPRNVEIFVPIPGGGAGTSAKRSVMKGVVTSPKGEKLEFAEVHTRRKVEFKLGPYELRELRFVGDSR